MEGYISTAEAARIIDCNDSRVRQLLRAGKLEGERVGRDWLVKKSSAEAYRDSERKPGPKPVAKPARKRKR
jgi:excisionase family DNA binding protein